MLKRNMSKEDIKLCFNGILTTVYTNLYMEG